MNKIIQLLQHVHIHPLLWIVIAISIATAHFLEVCLLIGIIFVHEMGHAAAASFFSWRIKKITLLPFGGVAEMEEHGNRPLKEEAIVVLAGPLQHIWMVALAYALLFFNLIPEDLYSIIFSLQFNDISLQSVSGLAAGWREAYIYATFLKKVFSHSTPINLNDFFF